MATARDGETQRLTKFMKGNGCIFQEPQREDYGSRRSSRGGMYLCRNIICGVGRAVLSLIARVSEQAGVG